MTSGVLASLLTFQQVIPHCLLPFISLTPSYPLLLQEQELDLEEEDEVVEMLLQVGSLGLEGDSLPGRLPGPEGGCGGVCRVAVLSPIPHHSQNSPTLSSTSPPYSCIFH